MITCDQNSTITGQDKTVFFSVAYYIPQCQHTFTGDIYAYGKGSGKSNMPIKQVLVGPWSTTLYNFPLPFKHGIFQVSVPSAPNLVLPSNALKE